MSTAISPPVPTPVPVSPPGWLHRALRHRSFVIGATLSLLEVPCEVLSEADVDPEEAPDEAAEELPELLVLPLEELDVLPEELAEPALTPLTVTFTVLLATVQPL